MSYKAVNNQGNYCSRPQTMSETVRKSDSWECRTISAVSKLIVTTFLLVMITGLFADPLTLPNIRGSISLSYGPTDVVYTNVKLFNASNNNQINQVYPDPDGSFVFSTSAGNYYLTIEMFRPDLGKFSYPIQTQNINIPNTSYCENLGTIQVDRYNMSSVIVSSDPNHPYFSTIDEALTHIFSAVNNGFNGDSVSLYLYPDEYQLSSFSFNYTNTANDALNLSIIGLGSEGASIEPWDNFLSVTAHRVNTTFSKIKFVRELNTNGNYFLIFSPSTSAKYSFSNCHFGKAAYNSRYACVSFDGLSGLSFYNCDFQYLSNLDTNNMYITTGNGSLKFLNCSDVSIDSSNFTNNSAFGGGGIYLDNCEDVDIVNSLFEANTSQSDSEESITWGYPGGAIFVMDSSEINIQNNQFFHNITTGSGGAVYLQFTSQFDISENLFRDNVVIMLDSRAPNRTLWVLTTAHLQAMILSHTTSFTVVLR